MFIHEPVVTARTMVTTKYAEEQLDDRVKHFPRAVLQAPACSAVVTPCFGVHDRRFRRIFFDHRARVVDRQANPERHHHRRRLTASTGFRRALGGCQIEQ